MANPRPGSMRDRARQADGQGSLFDAGPRTARPQAQPKPKPKRDGRPAGYPDEVLWTMAERFEKRAWENRVDLRSRGVPYIYRALEQTVDRIDIRTRRYRNEKNEPVEGPQLGICVVNSFWMFAPWDRDGDVIAQFADPLMFEWCVNKLARLWAHGRLQKRMDEHIQDWPDDEIARRPRREK